MTQYLKGNNNLYSSENTDIRSRFKKKKNSFKELKEKNCLPCTVKIFLRNEGEIKMFLKEETQKEFIMRSAMK